MKVYFENDYIHNLGEVLSLENPKSILLVTGSNSFKNSGLPGKMDTLFGNRRIIRVSGTGESPVFEHVLHLLKMIEGHNIELVIALGGGSVMDLAKILTLYVGNVSVFESDMANYSGLEAVAPIVAIPTTAGSGSEATHFAVMYKDEEKFSVASPDILPAYVILDSVLTHSLPKHITACSSIDAMCQALEALWALDANNTSDNYAMKALQFIYPAIREVVLNPTPASRKQMLIGAFYAGQAINISKTTGPHALSYFLTAKHGLQHGEAVAMNMEMFFELNFEYMKSDIQDFLLSLFDVSNKSMLIKVFSELKAEIGLRRDISDVGIKGEALKTYFFSADAARLGNNPGKLTPEKLLNHYLKKNA